MVGLGFAMVGIGLWSLYLRWRGGSTRAVAASRGGDDGARPASSR